MKLVILYSVALTLISATAMNVFDTDVSKEYSSSGEDNSNHFDEDYGVKFDSSEDIGEEFAIASKVFDDTSFLEAATCGSICHRDRDCSTNVGGGFAQCGKCNKVRGKLASFLSIQYLCCVFNAQKLMYY